MTSLQKVKTIATFEFLTAVKRVGWLKFSEMGVCSLG